jgi:response regulator NasT
MHTDRLLETAREQLPDSILVVHDPPASDGRALAGQIQGNYTCPLVLAAGHWDRELAKAATSAGYAAFLGIPATGISLALVLLQAEAGHNELRYLKDRVAELEQRLAERKLVEKAKGMVMLQQQLSEEQAFRALRSEAMHRRISLARLAEELLGTR